MGSSIVLAQLKRDSQVSFAGRYYVHINGVSSESYFDELDRGEVNEKNFTRVLQYRHIISLFLSISFTVQ